MSKYKRANYLIDKPFQLGFIAKYVIIIVLMVIITFGLSFLYYYWKSLVGENKYDTIVTVTTQGQKVYKEKRVSSDGRVTIIPHKIFVHGIPKNLEKEVFQKDVLNNLLSDNDSKEILEYYKLKDNYYVLQLPKGNKTEKDRIESRVSSILHKVGVLKIMLMYKKGDDFYFYDPKAINPTYPSINEPGLSYKMGDKINKEDINQSAVEKYIGSVEYYTTKFDIIKWPLLISNLFLILVIVFYSLFFSHRMAGPIYRLRVSLERMLSGDLNFQIRVRKTDFFVNVVKKLEKLRIKIKEGDFKK